MIEKDNIQELFSKSLENHSMPVRPELWAGVQAKMAAAATGTAVVGKGVSLLTKWIIGGIITGSTAVVVGVVALSDDTQDTSAKQAQSVAQVATAVPAESTSQTSEQPASDGKETPHVAAAKTDQKVRTEIKNSTTEGTPPPVADEVITTETEQKKETPVAVPVVPKTVPQVVENKQQKTDPQDKKQEVTEQKKPASQPTAATSAKLKIEFANIFTPNNDGENDYYLLKQHENVSSDDFSVTIMDASNHVIWKDTDPNFKWDGFTMSGDKAPEGKYICMIVGKDNSGKQFSKYTLFELQRD